jgi:hypothetical protein
MAQGLTAQSEFAALSATGADIRKLIDGHPALVTGKGSSCFERLKRRKEVHLRETPQHFLYFFPEPQGHGSLPVRWSIPMRGNIAAEGNELAIKAASLAEMPGTTRR